MRILVAGSYREDDNLTDAYRWLAQAIGRAAVEYGHTLMVEGVHDKRTFDSQAVDGAGASGARATVEVHCMIDYGPVECSDPLIEFHQVPYRWPQEQSGDKKLWSRIGGVAASDVMIMMGGRKGSDQQGELAIELRKPVVSVPGFRGASDEWFKSFVASYQSRPELHNGTFVVKTASDTAQKAARPKDLDSLGRQIIEFAELMAHKQRYFLSYAHENAEIADHLETLLLRAGRVVVRDEARLALGDNLVQRIEDYLQCTDTFIGL